MGVKQALVAAALILSALVASAQPNVEIYWDETDRADTVMDFGVTLEGSPVTLQFVVVNNESQDVAILRTNQQADPYYQIVNTPEVPPEDPRKEEFEAADLLPYVIPAGQTGRFGVTYRAIAGNPTFPVDVPTGALLELRVVLVSDSLGSSTDKTFLLQAIKTKNILASARPYIPFDSVYVLPKPVAPEEIYRVENVSSVRVPVVSQILDMQTSVVGSPEIEVDTFSSPEFGPKGMLEWTTRYSPTDMGLDSAHFLVVYKPNPNAAIDTVTARISGIGALQQLTVVNAIGTPQAVEVRGDTIDFGNVNADGSGGVVAMVILRNEGNVNVFVTDEQKSGFDRDTAAFKIERPILENGPTIRTNAFDTIVVRFDPVNGGIHRIRYDIQTDLLSRDITGIPDGAQTKTLFIEGFSRKPQIQVSPASLDFGKVVLLPECSSASIRQITIRNVGNIPLSVDSILIDPDGGSLQILAGLPLIIDVAEDTVIDVRYEPSQIELLSAKLVLFTTAFGVPIEIGCIGESVEPESIEVSVADTIRARPGTPIAVAVRVQGDKVQLASTSSITLTFDPTLMEYRGVETTGTASEGALIVRESESPRGSFTIELDANGTFLQRDTFLILTFETYLGTHAFTDLALSDETTLFGNEGCASILDVSVENGRYQIDSVCGLSYKTSAISGFVVGAQIFPNPATDVVRVTLATGLEQDVSIVIIDAFGRAVGEPLTQKIQPGVSFVTVPVTKLIPGGYFVDVRSLRQRQVLPLAISR